METLLGINGAVGDRHKRGWDGGVQGRFTTSYGVEKVHNQPFFNRREIK